ncbi:response regulator [Metarhizobium album]|uniref:response regulator n=1 Tax=Metarhizobium album TaxID=2182425 RepID=UPI003075CCF1
MGHCRGLEEKGFVVFSAATAKEAIRILAEQPSISVLFTDIDMPGDMDGRALTAAVSDRWPPVRIIVTSGMNKLGAGSLPARSRFIPKPYDPSAIVRVIQDRTAA